MHVAVGFMPAFKYLQKNFLIVFEHGHKARGYESAADTSRIRIGGTLLTTAATTHFPVYAIFFAMFALFLGSNANF